MASPVKLSSIAFMQGSHLHYMPSLMTAELLSSCDLPVFDDV